MKQYLARCGVAGLAPRGRASVRRGIAKQIAFQSQPDGAKAQTWTGPRRITPCALSFGRREKCRVTFVEVGFVLQPMDVGTGVAGTGAAGFVKSLANPFDLRILPLS